MKSKTCAGEGLSEGEVLPKNMYCNNTPPNIHPKELTCIKCGIFSNNLCYRNRIMLQGDRLRVENTCMACVSAKTDTEIIWSMYCGICGHLALEEEFKTCIACGEETGHAVADIMAVRAHIVHAKIVFFLNVWSVIILFLKTGFM